MSVSHIDVVTISGSPPDPMGQAEAEAAALEAEHAAAAAGVRLPGPIELRDREPLSDTWTRDEPRFGVSHPTVYIPQVEDRIRTQAEALAHASGEAVRYIEEQHVLCI
jgi:hypothetical protein